MTRKDLRESVKMQLFIMGDEVAGKFSDSFLNKIISNCYYNIITSARVIRLGGDSVMVTPTPITSLTVEQSISITNVVGNSAITSKTFDSYIDLKDINRYYNLINIRHNGKKVQPLKFEHISDTSTISDYFDEPVYYEAGDKLFFINGEGLSFALYYYAKAKEVTTDTQELELLDEFESCVVYCVLKRIFLVGNATQYQIFDREFKTELQKVKNYLRGKNQRKVGSIIPTHF